MAMLAGPRQRKRYNLVPKGKALFEDGDRFGTKMLEKMGWTKGKGLGSKENGQQEFIRIRYKNDANGLGYEDRDDQWTEHEKHFNGLLESLHAGDSNSNTASADDAEDNAPRVGFGFESSKTTKEKLKDKFSGQSLEERSKQSKARVHYKKFTKGKDMTQYSEKDLANIFGKKATAEENDFYSQLPSFTRSNEESDEEDEKRPAFELGTHTVNTGLSVSDYFKMKMEALKNKKGVEEKQEEVENGANGDENNVQDLDGDEYTESSRKKKKKSKKQKLGEAIVVENGLEAHSEEKESNEEQAVDGCENGDEESVGKSKKKKSRKVSVCETVEESAVTITVENEDGEGQRLKKKKKKKSADKPASDQVMEESKISQGNGPASGKVSLYQNGIDCDEIITIEDDTNEEHRPKTKKKKKSAEDSSPDQVTEECSTSKEKEITEKDSLGQSVTDYGEIIIVEDEASEEQRPKKKKKKTSTDAALDEAREQTRIEMNKDIGLPSPTEEVEASAEGKKKKNKKSKSEERAEMGEHSEKEPPELVANEHSQKKKKSKKRKAEESTEMLANDTTDILLENKKTKVSLTNEVQPEKEEKTELPTPSKKSKKNRKKEVDAPTAVPVKKFRNVDLASFTGSNASQQNGYGLSENLELKIVNIDGDQERIMKLWSGKTNKYNQFIPKREIYKNYMQKVKRARWQKKKIPKMKVKPLLRLNAFQSL